MISSRQIKILELLSETAASREIITATEIAEECGVSTKTIQNDIKELNARMSDVSIRIDSIAGKGYLLNAKNQKSLSLYLSSLMSEARESQAFNNKAERFNHIIGTLLFSKKPILSDMLANSVYVSRSQLSQDIKEIKEILQRYDLKMRPISRSGLCIEGSETNKRLCLMGEKIDCRKNITVNLSPLHRNRLGTIVFDILSREKYAISDLDIQNLILHVETAVFRIAAGFQLKDYNIVTQQMSWEIDIVTQIYDQLSQILFLNINANEILYLAAILQSRKILTDKDIISDEMEHFVVEILDSIETQFGMDLSNDIELRINLALHLTSLIARAKHSQLSNNQLLNSIKQTFPLAFDMAMLALYLVEKSYGIVLNQDEAGYLAAYFSLAQSNLKTSKNDLSMLVITSSRKSETILLRYNIQKQFGSQLKDLDIVQSAETSDILNPSKYHIVLTTTQSTRLIENPDLRDRALKINYFLTKEDIEMIENKISDIPHQLSFLNYLRQDLFFADCTCETPEELLRRMCEKIEEKVPCTEALFEAVMSREKYGATAFTNFIALPHPERLISTETVISVAVLSRPIVWGSVPVQIVFLVNVKKSSEGEMSRIYGVLSKLMQNKKYVREIIERPSYETLIKILTLCDKSLPAALPD